MVGTRKAGRRASMASHEYEMRGQEEREREREVLTAEGWLGWEVVEGGSGNATVEGTLDPMRNMNDRQRESDSERESESDRGVGSRVGWTRRWTAIDMPTTRASLDPWSCLCWSYAGQRLRSSSSAG
jgi:hypothetical protein